MTLFVFVVQSLSKVRADGKRAFVVQQKMAEYENHLLRKEVEHLRAEQRVNSQVQIALSEQLKKVKYERDVWKSFAAYDSNILERFLIGMDFEML